MKIHHIAIICSDYVRSKRFYTETLGLTVLQEVYRAERQSYKLDLALNGHYVIELFSFPNPPARPSRPEAVGLRHLAFAVPDLDAAVAHLHEHDVVTEPIRVVAEQRGEDVGLMIDTVTGAFDLRLRISFAVGIIISAPVWLWQLWAFLMPGLTRKEIRYTIGFVAAAILAALFVEGRGH